MKAPAVTIRFRKASATHVIYLAGKVLESGFDSEADARAYLETRHPELAKRARLDARWGVAAPVFRA